MNTANEKIANLTPKQSMAVMLLGSGKKNVQVAETLGVTAETISIWKRNPAFIGALNRMRRDIYDTTQDQLWSASTLAITTLTELMMLKQSRVRLDAAVALLKLCRVDDREQGMAHIGDEDL